ncbi:MAG TPA: nuclear transport factor 2 family protein [Candidatus Binatia bacterium]|jgi:ketosteroid isomerase-like protein|nr:nuclear transport factor 2 family protein [Candidatus Binatia bacterium]
MSDLLYDEPVTPTALHDRDAVRDVLLSYARGVDSRDLARVAACFTPDAAYDGALGRGTIDDALLTLRDAMARYSATVHRMGNQVVAVDGDRARSETDCLAEHVLADGTHVVVAVRYRDALVRRPDGWRIASRTVTTLWRRQEQPAHV